jgi:hypothetical protein
MDKPKYVHPEEVFTITVPAGAAPDGKEDYLEWISSRATTGSTLITLRAAKRVICVDIIVEDGEGEMSRARIGDISLLHRHKASEYTEAHVCSISKIFDQDTLDMISASLRSERKP